MLCIIAGIVDVQFGKEISIVAAAGLQCSFRRMAFMWLTITVLAKAGRLS